MTVGPDQSSVRHTLPSEWTARIGVLDRLRTLLAVCVGNRIAHLNPAGARMLALPTHQAAIGRSFFSFVHHDYADLAELGLAVFAEEASKVSIKLVREDRGNVDVELWVSCIDPAGEGVFLIEAHDITDHLRAAHALRAREQRLEGVINTVADGIITVDDRGTIQTFNPAAESIFGFRKEEVIGRNLRSLIPETVLSAPETEPGWVRTLASTPEIIGKRKDGEVVPLEMSVRVLQQGDELSFTSIVRDISARKAAEERVFRMAHHDALTELPNRHLFGDRVEEAFKRARRHTEKLALLFVDLDRFKPINDTCGHAVGDEVLREVARRLRAGVRATDTVARVGGDEFMVLLEELADTAEAEEVRQKLYRLLTLPMRVAVGEVQVGASIGVAVYPDNGAEIDELTAFADRDMYAHKHAQVPSDRLP